MSDDTRSVDVVVIGAGIVGNSLGYHLAKLGTRRILLIDKGGLPNPGGSTGHASNFIFPFEHSKMMTDLTTESTRQYKELGVFTESGGIEVVRTEARLQECLRKMSGAKSWGIEASMLTPAEVNKLVPYLDERTILGGLYFPRTGVVDSLRAGTLMREEAIAMGALEILANTEVTGFRKRNGRVSGVETTSGLVECGAAVICCGVWSPRIARMAGATVPLTPVVHQMVSVGPIELFGDSAGEIEYPIVRDVDKGMYERQHGGDMEVGSYAHRPILVEPDDIPPLELSVLSPTELPFTNDDFDPQMADALELMPELLGDERAGIRYAINGLISLTPDGRPLFGETEVRGLWCAAAVWIKEGPGSARTVAEWMTGTHPAVDAHEADISRFYRHQRTRQFVAGRAEEMYNKTYGIVHPAEQFLNSRNIRTSPMHQRERQLGAVFFETGGWERPNWYESNAPLLERYGDKVTVRHAEWDTRWWSPIAEAEHLAMRDRVGLVDLGAFAILDVHGQGALGVVQSVAVAQMDVPVGRVVYTPLLDPDGGMKADLTVMRLSPTRFRVVTGAAHGMSEKAWFENHLPEDGSTQVTDLTSAWTTIGVWGPQARALINAITTDDVSSHAFRFGSCRPIELGDIEVLASRISYVGESGWELYVPADLGQRAWDILYERGEPFGVIPVGLSVYLTSARLEKGYRAYGSDLTPEYDIVEAGLDRRTVKSDDFCGKRAHLAQRGAPAAARLCTLTIDYGKTPQAERRYPFGHEVLLTSDGEPIVDRKGRRSFVTSAGAGPSVGRYLLLGYLPTDLAKVGQRLVVECMGQRYPVEVVVSGNGSYFDPTNERLRG